MHASLPIIRVLFAWRGRSKICLSGETARKKKMPS